MTLQVTLQKPDATLTLSLKAKNVSWNGQNAQSVKGLPGKGTMLADTGKRTRSFTIQGRATGQQGENVLQLRDQLDDAWLNWYANADGKSLLTWGTRYNGNPYQFKVSVKGVTVAWASTQPGSSAVPILDYTITLEEMGTIGGLNP